MKKKKRPKISRFLSISTRPQKKIQYRVFDFQNMPIGLRKQIDYSETNRFGILEVTNIHIFLLIKGFINCKKLQLTEGVTGTHQIDIYSYKDVQ